MPISYNERSPLICPACRAGFESDIWRLVDAAERPDLAEALREGQLNLVVCPRCGYSESAGAPVLFHDPLARRVYFAPTPGAAEHELREQAQELLYLLVGSIPEEERQPYLGDLQVEQDLDGVRRAVLRRSRRPGTARQPVPIRPEPIPVAPPVAPPAESADLERVLEIVQELLSADTLAEFHALVETHPLLLTPAADEVLEALAATAMQQGERSVAGAISEARAALARIRSGADQGMPEPLMEAEPAPSAKQLAGPALQALLRASSPAELIDATRDHPALLEPWADAVVVSEAEATLDEGHERMAQLLLERRDALLELRRELTSEEALLRAVEALLRTNEEDELARVLMEYPALLTESTQEILLNLAAGAQARNDQRLAEYAVERRAMLWKVREGLEESA